MEYRSISIADAIREINRSYFPSAIQREFVWDTDRIEKLFDSLMSDFTIGSFLFWKVDRALLSQWTVYEFARDYDKENPHNDEATRDADFRGHHLIPILTDLGFDEFEALCEARRALLKGRLAVVMAS
mgnify:CR=1 FL=1